MIRFRRTERPVDASFSLSSLYQAMANERERERRETSENALAGGDGLHVAHTARGHAPTACSTLAPPSPNRGRPASALSPCRPAGPARCLALRQMHVRAAPPNCGPPRACCSSPSPEKLKTTGRKAELGMSHSGGEGEGPAGRELQCTGGRWPAGQPLA
jgi:hypothetical protein